MLTETTPATSTMRALRAATSDDHRAVETLAVPAAMVDGTLDDGAYTAMLEGYLVMYRTLARALRRAELPWFADRIDLRITWLEADLAVLAPRPGGPQPSFASACDWSFVSASVPALLGAAYVLEGSALGNAFLAPRLRANLKHLEPAFAYFRGFGVAAKHEFTTFGGELDARVAAHQQADAIEGAKVAFRLVGLLLVEAGREQRSPARKLAS